MTVKVAVVGRPNVGKSTLVNRIAASRTAIVAPEPGVTRDRNYVDAEWRGRLFTLIDTGGLVGEDPGKEGGSGSGVIETHIVDQALTSIDESDLAVFVVDGRAGLLPGDKEIARVLRLSGRPVILAVNKIDDREQRAGALEFYELGLGDPTDVSAVHGLGIGDLLDRLVEAIPDDRVASGPEDVFAAIAIVGRPNVGKSTLLNRLLGFERVVVHEEAGTTRDSIDTIFKYQGKTFRLVDTAGLKRPTRVSSDVEYYGSVRTFEVLGRADLALVLTDSVEGVTKQDLRIVEHALDRGSGVVIAPNKIDLLDEDDYRALPGRVRDKTPFLPGVPVAPVSAAEDIGLADLLQTALGVIRARRRRIKTSELNRFVQTLKAAGGPGGGSAGGAGLAYATQTSTEPPEFVFFVSRPRKAGPLFRRYLMNSLRGAFGFEGVPLIVHFRDKASYKR